MGIFSKHRPFWNGLKVVLSLAVGFLGIWLITRSFSLELIQDEFQSVNWLFVALAIGVIFLTVLSKAWRWYLMLTSAEPELPFRPVLIGLVLGQFFNALLPIARTGELVRLFSLPPHIRKAQTLGTLVLEKTLDTVVLVITFFVAVPFIVMPAGVDRPTVLAVLGIATLVILYFVAFEAPIILRITKRIAGWLPPFFEKWTVKIVSAGLDGLAALQDPWTALQLLLWSIWIGFLSILTPYMLFFAFGFPLGLAEGAAVHLAIMIGSIPSSAPANIGVFEFIVISTLSGLGIASESAKLSYAILMHFVVVGPIIIWSSVILIRLDWAREIVRVQLSRE